MKNKSHAYFIQLHVIRVHELSTYICHRYPEFGEGAGLCTSGHLRIKMTRIKAPKNAI